MPVSLSDPQAFSKGRLTKDEEDKDEEKPARITVAAPIEPVQEESVLPSTGGADLPIVPEPSFGEKVQNFGEAVDQFGLSIAASAIGGTLGAMNATVGLVKNANDYLAAGINKLIKAPFGGTAYDEADDLLVQSVIDIPNDLMNDFNKFSSMIHYEPTNQLAHTFVSDMGAKLEEARQKVGDYVLFGGTPSLEELEALDSVRHPISGPIKKAIGALNHAAVDIALMGVGSAFFKNAPKKGVLPTGEPSPVVGYGATTMPLETLDKLTNSKPRFSSYEEGIQRLDDIATGKVKSEIVIETDQGLPTKVISGQDTLLALKELNKRGVTVKDVKIRTLEKATDAPVNMTAVERMNKGFEADKAAERALSERVKESTVAGTIRNFFDRSGNVKSNLLKLGEPGKKAVMNLELAAGATPRAMLVSEDAWQTIYKDLSQRRGTGVKIGSHTVETERELFDEFIRAQRIIAIEKSKIGKGKKVKFEANSDGEAAASWLNAVRKQVGDERFGEYSARTEKYFEAAAANLKRMHDEGLISGAEYNRMKNINYMKTEFLDEIDPVTQQTVGGKTISVGESGIQPIKGGSVKGASLDSESLLNELLIRTENRIARNKANRSLYEIAVKDKKNGIVTLAKRDKDGKFREAPAGFDTISVMIDGKKQAMYMPQWLANEWKTSDIGIAAAVANTARIVSGSVVVRPLATGVNPAFAVTNLPRDIVHVWLATSKQYSGFAPTYLAQITRDIATILPDAMTKTGRYRDYIMEGGGMEFLTHQGRDVVATNRGSMLVSHRPKLKKIRDTLSYLNEQSELIVRLAVRERVIRNQREKGLPVDTTEATYVARSYLDFAQGGTVTKALDNFVPYLNATTQAYRTIGKNIKNDPIGASVKVAQLAAAYSGYEAYNMLYHSEAHMQIPEAQRRENIIIHTDRFIIDAQGNKRFVYYRIKKDPSTITPTVLFEQMVDKYITGKAPTDSVFDYMKQTLPGLGTMVPSLTAWNTYTADYNFWYNQDIYGRDMNIADYAKYKGLPGQPTQQVYKDFAQLFHQLGMDGFKPQAAQEAVKQVIPTNAYVQMAGLGYQYLFSDLNELEQSYMTEQWIAETPVVDRLYSLTHPAAVAMDELERRAEGPQTEAYIRQQKMKELLFSANQTRDYDSAREYARSFKDVDPFVYQDLMRDVEASRLLDKIFDRKQDQAGGYIPKGKGYWLRMLSLDSTTRAEVYFEEWRDATGEQKRWMDSLTKELSTGNLSFIDQEFAYKLSQLKKDRSSESVTIDD